MMKVKSACAFIVSTDDTLTAFVFDDHCFELFASQSNGLFQIFSAIGICSFVWHIHVYIPTTVVCTAGCSTAELSGNEMKRNKRDGDGLSALASLCMAGKL